MERDDGRRMPTKRSRSLCRAPKGQAGIRLLRGSQDDVTLFYLWALAAATLGTVSTSLVLIEAKMLSGYNPVTESLEELNKMPAVKKIEREVEQVTLYLDELTWDSQYHTLVMQQDIQVKDLKPANVKVYDYYMSEENAVTDYGAPCL
ncbi:alpha-2-macroglobulin-like protein 1 [Mauremys reevesii]|uniref:alpha-2-macroglobulin-like protein 1 n=1 Tax=Mauremys reevesii TaxID=260615 RepID=UPI00193ED131|nr:alpha-2-macroglobulin-like protein 1 [Mauremys reevesii]